MSYGRRKNSENVAQWLEQVKAGFQRLLISNAVPITVQSTGQRGVGLKRLQNQAQILETPQLGVEDRIVEVCRRGWTVWDCGPSLGKSSVLFSRCVGPDGLVVSFSPSREDFLQAHSNAAINESNNIMYLYVSIAGRSAERQFLDSLISERKLTLSEAAQDEDIPKPNLIRLYAQGANPKALLEAESLIKYLRPHLIVDLESSESHAALCKFAESSSYVLRSLTSGRRICLVEEIAGPVLCVPEEKVTF